MQFIFEISETLPPLAWCARISSTDSHVLIRHGVWVETRDNFFFEGAWNGRFWEGNFLEATVCMGSGGRVNDNRVVFATPTHTLERLNVIKTDDGVVVSNSLAFLLAEANDSWDNEYQSYIRDITAITKGLRHYTKTIPTRHGKQVELYYYCNILVDNDLSVTSLEKQTPSVFSSYHNVQSFLLDSLQELTRNANAEARTCTYEPLTTISSGYDSAAASVLATEIGCTQAVTYAKARSTFEDNNDSGRAIGDILNLEIIDCERETYLSKDDFPEAEFLASGTGGADVVLVSMEHLLPKKILVSGFAGQFWDRNNSATSAIERRDVSGNSLAEFRLRVGFIHVPVPYFLAVNYPSVQLISNSSEMKPWCLGNAYDKPIARRLIEEAGVPRHLFGQKKKAITQSFFSHPLREVMTPRSFQDFTEFSSAFHLYKGIHHQMFCVIMHRLYLLNAWICQKLSGLSQRMSITIQIAPMIPDRYRRLPTFVGLTFHWGMEKIKIRYQ